MILGKVKQNVGNCNYFWDFVKENYCEGFQFSVCYLGFDIKMFLSF